MKITAVTIEEKTLTEQTIDTFARIVRNGGKVPDGYTLEVNAKCNPPGKGWIRKAADMISLRTVEDLNLRLVKEEIPQPPRFSVSTDPIGVLDSQRPGMIAKFKNALDAAKFVVDKLNRGERASGDYEWKPIAPEMVPLAMTDVPPGSYFKRAGDSWLAPSDVCRTGVHFYGLDMPFEKLMEEGWQILRPGQTEWQKCEKVKP